MRLRLSSFSTFFAALTIFIGLLSAKQSLAQQRQSAQLLINGKTIELPDNGARYKDSVARTAAGKSLLIIRTSAPLSDEDRARFVAAGGEIAGALTGNTYIAFVAKGAALASLPVAESIVPFAPALKIEPALGAGLSVPGLRKIIVSGSASLDFAEISSRVKAIGGTVLTSPFASHNIFECELPPAGILVLAQNPEVLYIGVAKRDHTLNLYSQKATKANIAHAAPASGGWGLLGDSVTVGVGDNISGIYHTDLRDRIVNYNPWGYTNHGQHTNGTVGGAGTLDVYGEGFAPHVNLVDHLYNLIWANTGALRAAHEMRITSNSYANTVGSCTAAGTYDVYSEVLDTISLQHSDVLHVFAAGNDGHRTCSPYPQGFGTVTGGYQTAKNVLVVANLDKTYTIGGASSRGPIKDGRLKPEIAAVGTNVYSTKGSDTYLTATGTSMACPQVAGGAALVQQRYKQGHGGAYPSAALTKALLMNGAMDLGTPGPDFVFGFGVMDLRRSLTMLDSARFVQGSIRHAASASPVTITVPAGTAAFKVMLYWHDAPASPASGAQLINDLDLTVTDPSSVARLPLVLNPAATNVGDSALQGADHRNNVEQVVFYNPAAGTYTVNVSGYNVAFGPQPYVVVYDVVPAGVSISAPFADEAYENGAALNVYWTASRGTNTFTLEASTDNGVSWTTINSAIPAGTRMWSWTPTGINSGQCRMRITRAVTGETFTTALFSITSRPVLQLQSVQCPGYVAMIWNTIPNATGYTVYQKIGPFLQPVATTTDTFFTRSGLRTDSTYYFAVQPLIGAAKGFRSLGVSRQPATGACTGNISNNDLAVEGITAPNTGRFNTSSALTTSETLTIGLRNLDDAALSSYQVSYQLNGGAWTSQTISGIAAGAAASAAFTGLNLAAPGAYTIRVAVTNLSASDPVTANDTLEKVIRQLQNAPVNLLAGFTEDFESAARLTRTTDTMGFTPGERWDYSNNTDSGRLRTLVDSTITISGTRSVSMDAVLNIAAAPFNKLTGTFDLAAYDTAADEVRLEFDYRFSGVPRIKDSNRVWVRGGDTKPWLKVYDYDFSATTGNVINSGTLSLTDVLRRGGQLFSSSAQIAFGQRDTSVISQADYGNGLTLDNILMYKVFNDAGIARIISPDTVSCGLGAASPLTLEVYNGVSDTIRNVYLFYQLDGGSIMQDSILAIAGKDTIAFTFAQLLNTSASGAHTLNVWLSTANDSYHANDSIMGFVFRNQPLVASFPYLQNFETGDGFWYSAGRNNSWEFGTPASTTIKKAASGTKAWKTSLTGYYNDNELSYLYGPCFSIGGLSSPMLSFSVAHQIENCGGTLCDGAWVEYSLGGGVWTKLGAQGSGTNWYSSAAFQLWNSQSDTRWKVASISLPVTTQTLRLRFVFSSDAGAGFDGIAIDDVHIYDRASPLYTGASTGPMTQTVGTGGFTSFAPAGALLAQIDPGATTSLGNTVLRSYQHSSVIDLSSMQYYLPRSFVIHTQNAPTDSPLVRLYISDADVATLVAATGCPTCSKPTDAYELGITKYDDNSDTTKENDLLSDNSNGTRVYIPYTRLKWVPYDAGYYAEFKVDHFSEFWFNDGGPSNAFPLPITSLTFDVRRQASPEAAVLSWQSFVDTQVRAYEVQRSEDAAAFRTVTTVTPVRDNAQRYTYTDPAGAQRPQASYYRLKYTLLDGKDYYSNIRQVIWSGRAAAVNVYPNPTADGVVHVDWSAPIGSTITVAVTDASGRTLEGFTAASTGYNSRTEFSLASKARGVYFVHVTVGGERFDVKVTRL